MVREGAHPEQRPTTGSEASIQVRFTRFCLPLRFQPECHCMVGVAQLVRAPDCGSGGRRFNSGRSPFPNGLIESYHEPLEFRLGDRLERGLGVLTPPGLPFILFSSQRVGVGTRRAAFCSRGPCVPRHSRPPTRGVSSCLKTEVLR